MATASNRPPAYFELPQPVQTGDTAGKRKEELLTWLRELLGEDHQAPVAAAAIAPAPASPAAPAPSKAGVLCYTAKETMEKLQISYTKLWRLEKTGQLIPIPNNRHKRFPVEWVERYAAGEPAHPAMVRLWSLRVVPSPAKKRAQRPRISKPEALPDEQTTSPSGLELNTAFSRAKRAELFKQGREVWDGKPMSFRSPTGHIYTYAWVNEFKTDRDLLIVQGITCD